MGEKTFASGAVAGNERWHVSCFDPCTRPMEIRMYRDARLGTAHCFRRCAGVFCLGLGFLGLLLPLVPGIPLLIVGGLLLRPRASRRRYDRTDAYVVDTFRDHAPTRGRKSGRRLSGIERLQLGFWMFCRAITTRLDQRSRRR
jgi:hypothetical protein